METKFERLPVRLTPCVNTREDGSTFGIIEGATHAAYECGCRIVGNGTLTHPLEIERCREHDTGWYERGKALAVELGNARALVEQLTAALTTARDEFQKIHDLEIDNWGAVEKGIIQDALKAACEAKVTVTCSVCGDMPLIPEEIDTGVCGYCANNESAPVVPNQANDPHRFAELDDLADAYDPEDGGVPCIVCGATISDVTHDDNGGMCEACAAPDYVTDEIERVAAIVRRDNAPDDDAPCGGFKEHCGGCDRGLDPRIDDHATDDLDDMPPGMVDVPLTDAIAQDVADSLGGTGEPVCAACGKTISEVEYNRNTGACDACVSSDGKVPCDACDGIGTVCGVTCDRCDGSGMMIPRQGDDN